MKCKHCNGKGGAVDYFSEWDDCSVCKGLGTVTAERLAQYAAEVAAVNARVDAEMRRNPHLLRSHPGR